MKTISLILTALVAGSAVGWIACSVTTDKSQPYQPIQEANICYYNLETKSASLDPQLREYLKARLYSASANHINEGWLDGWEINFGPVDDHILFPVLAIKNASPTKDVYEAALERHPKSAKRNKKAELGTARKDQRKEE